MKATNIIWDADDPEDLEGLPTEIDIPEGMTDEDTISDYLSDLTGFCHRASPWTLSLASEPTSLLSSALTAKPRLRSTAGIRTAMDSRLSAHTAGNG